MHCLRSIMATASLSALLWRPASSRSLFALMPSSRSSSSAATRLSSPSSFSTHQSPRSRRSSSTIATTTTTTSLAFQNNIRAFRSSSSRPIIIATAYPTNNNNAPASSSCHRTLFTPSHLKSSSTSQAEDSSSSSTTTTTSESSSSQPKKKPIPTILLAGFLGSGKTSTLKHLLENNSNIKIGTIVNDVASVNIDARLISNNDDTATTNNNLNGAEGVVELQNGCACCSLADELFTSVVKLTKGGTRELDAIVVELSGVADPVAVRDNWEQARLQGHPATRLASLSRTVTLIDACTFGTDWMTWDVAGERTSWVEAGDDCAAARKVPELLAEQVEAADLLLVNKIDLAGEKQVGVASGVARGLNDKASIVEVEFGRVGVEELLGKMLNDEEEKKEKKEDGHSHDHGHSSKHDHKHDETESSACTEPGCSDTSHSHSHEHSPSSSECNDPDCTDDSHSHSHEHATSSDECNDPDCTDTSHSHSHEHKSPTTAADQLGITSFVYKSSTPFNSNRLLALLNRWPVPIKDSLDFGLVMGMGQDGKLDDDTTVLPEHQAFVGVLRSKGFCWMAPTKWSNTAGNDIWRHDTAMYWSHAGKHFGITSAGKWWGTLNKDQMKPYFANNMDEYDRIMREDWVSEEWGDRRQELVFIGTNIDEEEIREALDDCLCTAEEMDVYRAQVRNYLETTFSTLKGGPSLFDVGGTDHLDQ